MQLEPKDLYERLEFDKVIELLEKECLGELGVQAIQNLTLETEVAKIEKQLTEVTEYKLSFDENDAFPLATYEDLSEDVRHLNVEDAVLSIEGLQRINAVLMNVQSIFRFFKSERKEIYPSLFDIIRPIEFDAELIKEIDKVIDEKGEIRPNASPELMKISNAIAAKQRELDKSFRSIISQYKQKGWLSENIESYRNGRRVLSVPSEHKRKIRGIIHDESTTGKTAFIEPENIIRINNDIFDLETDKRREIYRILKALSATLRPYCPLLMVYQDLMIQLDVIRTKARLAIQMNATQPKLKSRPNLSLIHI